MCFAVTFSLPCCHDLWQNYVTFVEEIIRYVYSKYFCLDCVLIILLFLIIFDDLIIDVWNRLSNSNCDTSYLTVLRIADYHSSEEGYDLDIGFAIFKMNAFSGAYRKDIIKSTVDSGLLFVKECLRDGSTNISINFIVGPLDHPNIKLQSG